MIIVVINELEILFGAVEDSAPKSRTSLVTEVAYVSSNEDLRGR